MNNTIDTMDSSNFDVSESAARSFPFFYNFGKTYSGPFEHHIHGCPKNAVALIGTLTEVTHDGKPHAGDARVVTLSVNYDATRGVVKVMGDANWPHGGVPIGLMGVFYLR